MLQAGLLPERNSAPLSGPEFLLAAGLWPWLLGGEGQRMLLMAKMPAATLVSSSICKGIFPTSKATKISTDIS